MEVVSRDCGVVFIDGIKRGAPQVTQVADRWHLLQSLTKALERFFLNHSQAIKAANYASQVLTPPPSAAQNKRSELRNQRMLGSVCKLKTS